MIDRVFPPVAHALIGASQFAAHRRFVGGLASVEGVQRDILAVTLRHAAKTAAGAKQNLGAIDSYEAFREQVPVSRYRDYRARIEEQRATKREIVTHDCRRYQPTSGSSSERKWIPYNRLLLAQFDEAIGAWLHPIYRAHPRIMRGRHYWSLSWLPTELRSRLESLDDLGYFPLWKRLILRATMAVPNAVSTLPTLEASKFATLVHLVAAGDLTMISVWSPTFLLTLLHDLATQRERIARCLQTGSWPSDIASLDTLECPRSPSRARVLADSGDVGPAFTSRLWPELSLLSAWDTSTSAAYAEQLRRLFPSTAFSGKGLFATEGVVTIPFGRAYALAYRSHFYEFVRDDGRVVPAWELREGQSVMPIVTTGNGLLRYAFDDRLSVVGFADQCPLLHFMGRTGTVDLVGEKLGFGDADAILRSLRDAWGHACEIVSFVALEADVPGYGLLVGADRGEVDRHLLAAAEERLERFFHYKLARELGQLAPLRLLVARGSGERAYVRIARAGGMIEGDVKLESILCATPSAVEEGLRPAHGT